LAYCASNGQGNVNRPANGFRIAHCMSINVEFRYSSPLRTLDRRPPGRCWSFAFAVLAGCVFLWGLQYKLSLYEPPQSASHSVPMAKLLSRNEETRTLEGSNFISSKPLARVMRGVPNAALFLFLILYIYCLPALSHRQRPANPPWQLRRALLEAFYVRPPPAVC
jgi:hypothetical protein